MVCLSFHKMFTSTAFTARPSQHGQINKSEPIFKRSVNQGPNTVTLNKP